MNLISKIYRNLLKKNSSETVQGTLCNFLQELLIIERKIHGVTLLQIKNGEEEGIENANHLLVLLKKHPKKSLKKVLKEKDVIDFLDELTQIRSDFLYLKKQITKKDKLKQLIAEFTLKCIDPKNFKLLEKIFKLEKQLFQVLERQDQELEIFFKELGLLRIKKNPDDTLDYFIDAVSKIRGILAGHLDYHELWEEEKSDFSNLTHILYSLQTEVKKQLPNKK